ncbi:TIGR03960 family B12-binding radical SAM protein [Acetanaerobacterium elongatum]|uniref:Radical SAM family uncharacterized protein n=1 Tax=Acetanaerobacterium elongatum TaxID=258515 RepID=A0A1H0ATI5_9FIRM|nr:TIGR03960 family B12-binding radical SAM protein [Acetanaerobacterium elongatum]SDN36416.1 radical SAM family uncharacterized protein [Acetanaerobacterium elongatum]
MLQLKETLDSFLTSVEKPARYIGGELGCVVKNPKDVKLRFAFCFPDTYEVGMSHLGMKILYSLLNSREEIWCERVFTPWLDMQQKMREYHIPLYGLESLDPIAGFDIIGFSLQYELSYTNVLNMLDLAGVPLKACDRHDLSPLVVAGGPCTCNPEPMADFIDLFMLGEGEEHILLLSDLYIKAKEQKLSKREFLKQAAQIEGVYAPSLYTVDYNHDGTIAKVTAHDGAPNRIRKAIIKDLDKVFYPKQFVVPFVDIVFDRAQLEVMRGCLRGCRFCQAGFIYRPLREKDANTLNNDAHSLCESTGYEEVSLSSLSTSDYSQLNDLLGAMIDWTSSEKINLALPSLRIDNFSEELMEKIKRVRKSGLTFAPEAGTQRLRDVINKNITEDEILNTCKTAFEGGYTAVKLYFMLGLPTETMEDVLGIIELAQKVVDLYYSLPTRQKGKGVTVSVSVATFVPKPFTPFEFEPQDTRESVIHKHSALLEAVRKDRKITVSWSGVDASLLEAVLARGDRRLGEVIEEAYHNGSFFDSWTECFHYSTWENAMKSKGLDPAFYANRARTYDEVMPWDHLDYYITKSFLVRENQTAHKNETTPHCRIRCAGCGASDAERGVCVEQR